MLKNVLIDKNLALLLGVLQGKSDDQLMDELKIGPQTLTKRKQKLAVDFLQAKERLAKCARLPPGGWPQTKPQPIAYTTTKVSSNCKTCGKEVVPNVIPELERGEHAGERTSFIEAGYCSDSCYQDSFPTRPMGKPHRIETRGEYEEKD